MLTGVMCGRGTSLLAVIAVLAFSACGGDGDAGADGANGAAAGPESLREATLVLDFLPGAVHAGIYHAREQGFYRDQGIELEIIEPTSTADTLRLIDAGQADFGIADGIDVAGQIDRGRGAQAVMAITQRPSGGIIALEESGIRRPADMEGTTVGITGVPSDELLLEAALDRAGLTTDQVETVTIGFNGVRSLANGKIDAFIGYIPADGVQLEVDGHQTHYLPFDEIGGPSYPGLVVFSTQRRIERDTELTGDFVAATTAGYEAVLRDPEAGVDSLLAGTTGVPRELAEAGVEAYEPLWRGDAPAFGDFSESDVRDLTEFLARTGLTEEQIPPRRFYTDRFVGLASPDDG